MGKWVCPACSFNNPGAGIFCGHCAARRRDADARTRRDATDAEATANENLPIGAPPQAASGGQAWQQQ
eukprot:1560139-Alexandrium_andersonii.AAC.1